MMTILPAVMLVYVLDDPTPRPVRMRASEMAACVTTAEALQADPRVRSWQCHHEDTREVDGWRREPAARWHVPASR